MKIAAIDLINNLTNDLYVGNLQALSSVKITDLTDNQFEEILTLLAQKNLLTAISELDVSRNGLTELPETLWQLTALKNLNVCRNLLTTLSSAIGQLINLNTLNIARNQVSALPAAIGRLTRLQKFVASFNQLTKLPATLVYCVELKVHENFFIYNNPWPKEFSFPTLTAFKEKWLSLQSAFRRDVKIKEQLAPFVCSASTQIITQYTQSREFKALSRGELGILEESVVNSKPKAASKLKSVVRY